MSIFSDYVHAVLAVIFATHDISGLICPLRGFVRRVIHSSQCLHVLISDYGGHYVFFPNAPILLYHFAIVTGDELKFLLSDCYSSGSHRAGLVVSRKRKKCYS